MTDPVRDAAPVGLELEGRPDPDRVLARIRALLGPEAGAMEGGVPVARPDSDQVTAELLRVAGEEGWRVLPEGAGLEGIRRGPVPDDAEAATGTVAAPDLIVSTLAMNEVIEYESGDLVVRARAGVRLGRLQEEVARERQWLALDPPGGDGVTLGGVVATSTAGPVRVRYGRPRDQLLGLTLVDGSGRVLPLGGRVVKNVAGFDLVRLATGSRGKLGVVTEVTFRLFPLPEEDRTLVWDRAGAGEAWTLGRELALLPLPISSAELLGGAWGEPLDEAPSFRVLIRLGGSPPEVASMRRALSHVGGEPSRELEGPASREAARVLSERDGASHPSFRVHTLPDRGRPIAERLASLPARRFALHLLNGTFRVTPESLQEPGQEPGVDADAFRALAGEVRAAGGVLRFRGTAGKPARGMEVGAEASGGVQGLESRVLDEFDPAGVLPGRWSGTGS